MKDEQQLIRYLKKIRPPEVDSTNHRDALRKALLQTLERKQNMKPNPLKPRLVYAAIALVCISAIAFASAAYLKWRFVNEHDGVYYFETEPEVHSEVIKTPDGGERKAKTVHVEGVGINAESREDAERQLADIEQGNTVPARQTVKELKQVIQTGPVAADEAEKLAIIGKLQTDAPFSEAEALALLEALDISGDYTGLEALELVDTLRRDGTYTKNGLTIELNADGVRISQIEQDGSENEADVREIRVKRQIVTSPE